MLRFNQSSKIWARHVAGLADNRWIAYHSVSSSGARGKKGKKVASWSIVTEKVRVRDGGSE